MSGRLEEVLRRDAAAAWLAIESAAFRVATRVGRRFRFDHAACEDLAHDAMLVAGKDDFAAIARADPATPVEAWLAICCENLARERLRRRRRDRTGTAADRDPEARSERPSPRTDATDDVAELLGDLTQVQRGVEEARLDAGSERKAAVRLGVSRNRVHDVHRRAMRRLRRAVPTACDDAAWGAPAAACAREAGADGAARLLDLVAAGRTRRQIAATLGITEAAVRGRVSRARRRWGALRESCPPPRRVTVSRRNRAGVSG